MLFCDHFHLTAVLAKLMLEVIQQIYILIYDKGYQHLRKISMRSKQSVP